MHVRVHVLTLLTLLTLRNVRASHPAPTQRLLLQRPRHECLQEARDARGGEVAPVGWPRPEFRLEAPQISFINLPDSGPNLQKIRLKIPACS